MNVSQTYWLLSTSLCPLRRNDGCDNINLNCTLHSSFPIPLFGECLPLHGNLTLSQQRGECYNEDGRLKGIREVN